MYIDGETFAILRLELENKMVNGKFYRRYLNLPDPYGQQETSFKVIFEYQKLGNKMYLKYQREEDTYNLFNKATNEIVLRQSYMKELFVNNILKGEQPPANAQSMNINKSVEGQALSFNPEFWKHYNAPLETSEDSKIIKELQALELKATDQ